MKSLLFYNMCSTLINDPVYLFLLISYTTPMILYYIINILYYIIDNKCCASLLSLILSILILYFYNYNCISEYITYYFDFYWKNNK